MRHANIESILYRRTINENSGKNLVLELLSNFYFAEI